MNKKYLKTERYTKKYFNKLINYNELSKIGNTFIAGGALMDVFLYGEITSDVDLFCDSEKTFDELLNYFNNNGGIHIHEDNEIVIQFEWKDLQIDISKKFFSSPEKYIEDCFFILNAIVLQEEYFYYHGSFFSHLEQGIIGINNITRPFELFRRIQKYNKRGFVLSDMDILKIVNHINALDKKDLGLL